MHRSDYLRNCNTVNFPADSVHMLLEVTARRGVMKCRGLTIAWGSFAVAAPSLRVASLAMIIRYLPSHSSHSTLTFPFKDVDGHTFQLQLMFNCCS